jgi:hypothetical protein
LEKEMSEMRRWSKEAEFEARRKLRDGELERAQFLGVVFAFAWENAFANQMTSPTRRGN